MLPNSTTKQQAEDAFAVYAEADAKLQQVTAKADEQIIKIREKYAEQVTRLGDIKSGAMDILQSYAENNREEFGKKKSMELTHGIIGFRTGTPALKAAKSFTWKSITTLLAKLYPDYVRHVTEPAKDKILADRLYPATQNMMVECGIIVDQAESFFVEPKKELAEAL